VGTYLGECAGDFVVVLQSLPHKVVVLFHVVFKLPCIGTPTPTAIVTTTLSLLL